MLTPYCHCKEPLKVKHYKRCAIMPAIVLGFIPAIMAIAMGSLSLLIFAIFLTIAASGDFLIINLLKNYDSDIYVKYHPSEAGFYVWK